MLIDLETKVFGDSHGKSIFASVSGIPAGISLSAEKVNKELFRRKNFFGRGERMLTEDEKAEFMSGIYNGKTTGSPVIIKIDNRGKNTENSPRYVPRAGHGDYSAYAKYLNNDFNVYAERNSARWTSAATAAGNICLQILELFGIEILSVTKRIGKTDSDISDLSDFSENNLLYAINNETGEIMKKEIGEVLKMGDTIGGEVHTVIKNLIPGIGSYDDFENKLNVKISSEIMKIPSVKGIIFGKRDFSVSGKNYHDKFDIKDNKIIRLSNNCGGIEGGFSNGNDIYFDIFIKPIPTLFSPDESVNILKKEKELTPYIRSDSCIVPAIAVISKNISAVPVLEGILNTFGNDNIDLVLKRYKEKKDMIK